MMLRCFVYPLTFDRLYKFCAVLVTVCHSRRDFEICVQCPSVIRLIGARALTVIFIGTLQYKWNLWTRAMPLPYPGSFGCSNPTLLLQAPAPANSFLPRLRYDAGWDNASPGQGLAKLS